MGEELFSENAYFNKRKMPKLRKDAKDDLTIGERNHNSIQ